MSPDQLYRLEILEHYRKPQNFGRLKKSTYQTYVVNPLCGDEMDLQLLLDRRKKIKNVKFLGRGCALSIASASLFTESLKGKGFADLKKIKPQRVIKNMSVPIGPARRKCVLLVYEALQKLFSAQEDRRPLPLSLPRPGEGNLER